MGVGTAGSRIASFASLTFSLVACSAHAGPPEGKSVSASEETFGCRKSLNETNGAPCGDDDTLRCDFDFSCGSFTQLASCDCKDHAFSCHDPFGEIAPGMNPQCVENASADTTACPATLEGTNGVACEAVGRTCYFDGDLCQSGVTLLNPCICTAAGEEKSYVCSILVCPPSG